MRRIAESCCWLDLAVDGRVVAGEFGWVDVLAQDQQRRNSIVSIC